MKARHAFVENDVRLHLSSLVNEDEKRPEGWVRDAMLQAEGALPNARGACHGQCDRPTSILVTTCWLGGRTLPMTPMQLERATRATPVVLQAWGTSGVAEQRGCVLRKHLRHLQTLGTGQSKCMLLLLFRCP